MPPKLRTPLRWMLAAATLFLAAPLPAASGAVLGGLTELLAGPAGCVTSDGNLGVLDQRVHGGARGGPGDVARHQPRRALRLRQRPVMGLQHRDPVT